MAKAIYERIRNARSSLENAEQSFRENNGTRGELDLMLAEAEIKHLREKNGWISIWNRQRLALLFAAIVILAGYGGWLYAGAAEEGPVEFRDMSPVTVTAAGDAQTKVPQTEAARQDAVPTFTYKPKQKQQTAEYHEEQVDQRNVKMSSAEMQNLVRAARRTLSDAN